MDRSIRSKESFLSLRDEKFSRQSESLPKLPSDAAKIKGLPASELVVAMKRGIHTCVDVMTTYCRSVADTHGTLNAITEVFFTEALMQARKYDNMQQTDPSGLDLLPLFGLPLSVKDQFHQKGAASTLGCSTRVDEEAEDGAVVHVLRSLGAIPFVRTTVPQLLMVPETQSLLFGTSCNPWNLARTPGGSSGGEGALVGGGHSPIGIGTDIGGSLRLPALYCGVTTIKATSARMPVGGIGVARKVPYNGNEGVVGVCGPVARTVADTELLFKAMTSPAMVAANANMPPIPFNESDRSRQHLRVGAWSDLGFWPASAPERRAVREASEAAEAAGHTIVPFAMPESWVEECVLLYYAIMSSDGSMKSMRGGLFGEPLLPLYQTLYAISRIPACIKPLFGVFVGFLDTFKSRGLKKAARNGYSSAVLKDRMGRGEPGMLSSLTRHGWLAPSRLARISAAAKARSAVQYWDLIAKRKELFAQLMEAIDHADIDTCIVPGVPPAFPHGSCGKLTTAVTGTFIWNLMHVPAGSVPVCLVTEAEALEPLRDGWGDLLTAEAIASGLYSTAAGMPIGVQVIAKPFKEELVLNVMEGIEKGVRFPALWKQ